MDRTELCRTRLEDACSGETTKNLHVPMIGYLVHTKIGMSISLDIETEHKSW